MADATRRAARLPGLTRLVVLAAVAAIVGGALGAGLATLRNAPEPLRDGGTPAAGGTPATPSTLTSTSSASTSAESVAGGSRPARIAILSTVLHPAAGLRGQQRRRARLSVGVRVTNRGDRTITVGSPVLVAGGRVQVDRNATAAAADLLLPIPAGSSARGVLRFETAGAITDHLTSTQRASLQIRGRTVALRVRIGNRAGSSS